MPSNHPQKRGKICKCIKGSIDNNSKVRGGMLLSFLFQPRVTADTRRNREFACHIFAWWSLLPISNSTSPCPKQAADKRHARSSACNQHSTPFFAARTLYSASFRARVVAVFSYTARIVTTTTTTTNTDVAGAANTIVVRGRFFAP